MLWPINRGTHNMFDTHRSMQAVQDVCRYVKGEGYPPGATSNERRNIRRRATDNYRVSVMCLFLNFVWHLFIWDGSLRARSQWSRVTGKGGHRELLYLVKRSGVTSKRSPPLMRPRRSCAQFSDWLWPCPLFQHPLSRLFIVCLGT